MIRKITYEYRFRASHPVHASETFQLSVGSPTHPSILVMNNETLQHSDDTKLTPMLLLLTAFTSWLNCEGDIGMTRGRASRFGDCDSGADRVRGFEVLEQTSAKCLDRSTFPF